MFCSISGETPQEPVLSIKTGHVYERRLIEKYITESGVCPITGQSLSISDLVSIKSNPIVRPRAPTATSLPALLLSFQNEWDATSLELFSLRRQLQSTKEELAHSLYQYDAACRVIAKLLKEREGTDSEPIEG